MNILIAILLLFISGLGRAVSDTLWFWYSNSIFAKYPKIFNPQFWNPRLSYKNKYNYKNYYIRLAMSTFLVMFTDAWHLFQFISYLPIVLLVALTYSLGLDIYPLDGFLEITVFVIAMYSIHLTGNTFTKTIIKTKDRITKV